jgi:predicted P-loop ATPase
MNRKDQGMPYDTTLIRGQYPVSRVVGRFIDLRRDGREFKAPCPFHKEHTPSFTVNDARGFFHCFGCGAHGDAIDFVVDYARVSFREACRIITGQDTGDAPPPPPSRERSTPDPQAGIQPIVPVPPGVSPIAAGHRTPPIWNPKREKWTTYIPSMIFPYRNENNALLGLVLRVDFGDGVKITPAIQWCRLKGGEEAWCHRAFPTPRSLYGLEKLTKRPDAPVLLCEGEKAADAAQRLLPGHIALTWPGGAQAVHLADWSALEGRNVTIWPDADEQGVKAAEAIRTKLTIQRLMTIIPRKMAKGWDAADAEKEGWEAERLASWLLANVEAGEKPPGPLSFPGALPPNPRVGWEDQLIRNENWSLKGRSVRNARLMLANHQDMLGVLAFNEMSGKVELVRRPPWHDGEFKARGLTDVDATEATAWLEGHGMGMQIATVHQAIVAAARDHIINPLHNYLGGLEWDGTPRLDTWLTYYLGAEDRPAVRAMASRFLIGAVARAMAPGCKMDTMLILEGPQGLKKSTALRTLFGPDFFTDEIADLNSKDAALQLQGVWCVEIAELDALNRSDTSAIKAWLTRTTDRFRPPYGRSVVEMPRACVLAGTVNQTGDYLRDSTGARRFWPVQCTAIDIDALTNDRDQLWAEAITRHAAGHAWWIEGGILTDIKAEQEARYDNDPWESRMDAIINHRPYVTADEVLDALEIKPDRQTQAAQKRVTRYLRKLGWTKRRATEGGVRARYLYPPEGDG